MIQRADTHIPAPILVMRRSANCITLDVQFLTLDHFRFGSVPRPTVCTDIGADRPLVLVADDNPDNRAIFTAVLGHAGFRVVSAAGGLEAVEIARREHLHFVLMDLTMPDLDGVEALRRIRAEPERKRVVPILVVTAQHLYSPAQARADGFCGIVHKPVAPRHLMDAIERCLADARSGSSWTELPRYDAGAESAL